MLNAIGNYALVKDPNLKVRYVTSEEFTNEFIEALADTNQSSGQIKEFNRRYREVDVLLIDDIQFLSGKDATLEQFFHTFNTLHQANKRIVIASDVPPKDLQGFNERLISRFESGLTVDVKPPDLETRIAILRMIATMNGSNIPNDVFNLIAERFTENIRELEGALNRVTAMASLSNQPVTKALAEQTLQDFFTTDVEIKPADIITQVAKYFYLTFDDIVGRSRTKKIALARQIAMYLVRELTSMSLNDIGLGLRWQGPHHRDARVYAHQRRDAGEAGDLQLRDRVDSAAQAAFQRQVTEATTTNGVFPTVFLRLVNYLPAFLLSA